MKPENDGSTRQRYSEKLKDPRWQKKRLEIFQRDDWTCVKCQETESTLHVHHFRYVKGLEPWEYPNEDLVTLCEECHREETECWSQEVNSLIRAIYLNGGFSPEVNALACSINESEYPANVTIDMITRIFHNKKLQEDIFWQLYPAKKEENREG